MNDKKIMVEITDRQLAAILAADYCLRRSRQAQCGGLYIENIHDAQNSRQITFQDAVDVLGEFLYNITTQMDGESEKELTDVTKKYMNALSAFSCDFELAKRLRCQNGRMILNLPDSVKLQRDIELLSELEAKLRYGQLKIMGEADDDL